MIAGNEDVLNPADEPTEQQSREVDEKEVFALLVKPRVRYDVEVVTKLIVYTGIAWFAVALIPIIFEVVGLGTNHLRTH
ncbi:hypothetical protein NLG97_g11401 [Lecanicillium saksenae]|uniref:Uncharacterized protein n=1 Tax=Lecanicillium saksenae TaxID=468837 RepID=A0ACC1QC57_9HYPO|nr:hypothetical protein NLG97_g11401 [Lecanicillium saksenae]